MLLPVCASPGHLHVVHSDDTHTDALIASKVDIAKLTRDELDWLRLVALGLELCGESGGDVAVADLPLPAAATQPASASTIPDRIGAIHEALGRPLQGVWRPTSTAPLWVCSLHAREPHASVKRPRPAAAGVSAWHDTIAGTDFADDDSAARVRVWLCRLPQCFFKRLRTVLDSFMKAESTWETGGIYTKNKRHIFVRQGGSQAAGTDDDLDSIVEVRYRLPWACTERVHVA